VDIGFILFIWFHEIASRLDYMSTAQTFPFIVLNKLQIVSKHPLFHPISRAIFRCTFREWGTFPGVGRGLRLNRWPWELVQLRGQARLTILFPRCRFLALSPFANAPPFPPSRKQPPNRITIPLFLVGTFSDQMRSPVELEGIRKYSVKKYTKRNIVGNSTREKAFMFFHNVKTGIKLSVSYL